MESERPGWRKGGMAAVAFWVWGLLAAAPCVGVAVVWLVPHASAAQGDGHPERRLLTPGGALAALDGLRVASEHRCTPYDRTAYGYSQDEEVRMIREYGGVFGPYEMRFFAHRGETDIEHIVAVSEAHESGLCGASRARMSQFASDDLNLTLASPGLNRHEKIAYDFAEWRPAHNACWMAGRVVQVKVKWALTVDVAERDALRMTLAACSDLAMRMP